MVSVAGQDTKFLICTLNKQIYQEPLNLCFLKGDTVKFMCNGKGYVHLTGYLKGPFAENDDELKRSSIEEDKEGEKRTSLKRKINFSDKHIQKCLKASKKIISDNETWEKNTDDDYDTDDSEDYKLEDYTDDDDDDDEEEEEEEEEDWYDYDDLHNNYLEHYEDDIEMNESKNDTIEQKRSEDQKKKKAKVTGKESKKKPKDKNVKIKKEKSNEKILVGDVRAMNVEIGTGKVAEMGKNVTIYYRSRVKLDKKNPTIDECLKGDGFSFQVGSGRVIPGVNVGIVGMKVGGKRSLVIPPRMAYV